MSLSSLLAHALRQIYDAVIITVECGPSELVGTGNINASATEFLTAAVTTEEVNQVNALLEGMVHTHPQVFIERTFLSPVSCSRKSISYPNLRMIPPLVFCYLSACASCYSCQCFYTVSSNAPCCA